MQTASFALRLEVHYKVIMSQTKPVVQLQAIDVLSPATLLGDVSSTCLTRIVQVVPYRSCSASALKGNVKSLSAGQCMQEITFSCVVLNIDQINIFVEEEYCESLSEVSVIMDAYEPIS
jgi:hypothetical protein